MKLLKRGDVCIIDPINRAKQKEDGINLCIILENKPLANFCNVLIVNEYGYPLMSEPMSILKENLFKIEKHNLIIRLPNDLPAFSANDLNTLKEAITIAKFVRDETNDEIYNITIEGLTKLQTKLEFYMKENDTDA